MLIKKCILVVASLATTMSLNAETSAFGAGDLNSKNPYGLTDNERVLLKNKQEVANLESNFNSVNEQVQGIQSLIEGLSSRLSRLEQKVNDMETMINGNSGDGQNNIENLKKYVKETRAIQEQNYQNITETLKKLGTLIDQKNSTPKNTQKDKSNQKTDLSKSNNNDIFNEAIKLFNANKFEDARVHFEHLISKNNRPATSNFYLGEIAYKEKSYATAIQYYQKSIKIDDKASYMPKLLYHTAISFDKVGDTASANRFYKALKVGFPETKEAQASPNRK